MNQADILDQHESNVAQGVILSAPLLLFPSRSSSRPSAEVVREACRSLAMRLGQVNQQEAALRSLSKIREALGSDQFDVYLREIDDSMMRNFELLCDVYGLVGTPMKRRPRVGSLLISTDIVNLIVKDFFFLLKIRFFRYFMLLYSDLKRQSKTNSGRGSKEKSIRRYNSADEKIKDIIAVDKTWESDDDSDESGIEDTRSNSGSSITTSARVVLETEIKFDQETAITMTILEEQDKETRAQRELEVKAIESNAQLDDKKKTAR